MSNVENKPEGKQTARSNEQRPPQRRSRAQQDMRYDVTGLIPRGWDWQWNTYSVLGKVDTENMIGMQEDGWTPVTWSQLPPLKRLPGLDDKGLKEPVVRGGLMLMQRPLELTMEARAEDKERADDQVRTKLAEIGQAPPDTLPRAHPKLDNKIVREFGPAGIPVPEN